MKRLARWFTAAALGAAFLMAGCSTLGDTLFGEVDSEAQLAWRKAAGYVYVAVPIRNYVESTSALESTQTFLCNLDQTAFDAFQAARSAAEQGGDDLAVSLLSLSSALASLNLEVFRTAEIPDDPGDIAARSIVWVSVGARSVAEMRLFRKEYVQPKIEAMVAGERDPTAEEWQQIEGLLRDSHTRIQAACGAET